MKKFINFTIYSSVIPLAAGAVQLVTGTGDRMTAGFNRINGTFVHPNPFAYYLLIILAASFISIYNGKYKSKKIAVIRIVIALSAFVELIFTYTRGAWIGFIFMALVIFFKMNDKRKYKLIIPAIICTLPFISMIAARFSGVLSSRMEDSSLATRLYIWSNMFSISMESPVTGHGLGTFEIYAQRAINWRIEAHNEYLRIFFETGLVGLTVYLFLILSTLYFIYNHGNLGTSELNVTVFSLFLTFLLMSFADNIIDNLVSQWYLWAFAAMALAERGWAHEGAVGQQIPLPQGWKRNLLFCIKQNVPDA
jgi:O-antigen ligase